MSNTASREPIHVLAAVLKDAKGLIATLTSEYRGDAFIKQWYNNLCKALTNLIISIGKFCNVLKYNLAQREKENTLLYLTQISTILGYLIDIFVEESNIKFTIVELRNYATKRLLFCLEQLEFTLLQKKTESCSTGNFIDWMDVAIENVLRLDTATSKESQHKLKQFNNVKASFEEVLSYGMSIAQVASSDDCKVIKGSSQSVLETLSSLHSEITKELPNRAMVNLFKEACISKLCKLEENVNLAVLRLCADVFSEYTTLLNKIHTFCMDEANKGNVEELESIVADFDLHVDRIMQIGLFAVSCLSGGTTAMQIKSCLASLEALETELVPAFYSLLSDNSNVNRCYASLLKRHWEQQANQLKERIYHIIEPYTFCQVINRKMATLVEQVTRRKNEVKNFEFLQTSTAFSNYGRLMKVFISVILSINLEEIERNKLKTLLMQYEQVLRETDAAVKILLLHSNTDTNAYIRIIKRCKVVITVGTALQNIFEQESEDKENKVNESINDLKKDEVPVNNRFLEHIMNKGRRILNERSILYKTPRKNALGMTEVTNGDSPTKSSLLSRPTNTSSFSKRNTMSFKRQSKKDITFDFTGILNDLTNISASMNGGST